MDYKVALPPSLSNVHSVLWKYVPNPSHEIQMDNVQVRYNLNVVASPVRIEDREVRQLRGKEIILVKGF